MIKHGHVYAIPKQFFIVWVVSFVCMLAVVLVSIRYANYVDEQSNKRWCGVVNAINDAYKKDPPTTASGQTIAHEMQSLRASFKECS